MRDYLAVDGREDLLREIFPRLNSVQVAVARNYFSRCREEIQKRIDDDAALIAEAVAVRYPGLVRIAA